MLKENGGFLAKVSAPSFLHKINNKMKAADEKEVTGKVCYQTREMVYSLYKTYKVIVA